MIGSFDDKITAYPPRSGAAPRTKVFHTGAWFTSEDMIPKRVFFDFGGTPEPGK